MKSRQSACRDLRTDMVNTFDGSPVSAFAYTYDAVGRRTQRLDSGLTTNLFGYNMRSELADAIMGTNVYAYLYDPIGNRQLASANEVTNLYQANELNQYTNINQGAVEPVYDLDGNMTQLGPWAYDWDGENRLISVSSNGVPVVQNQYDYMSRRIMKATATQTNTFLYDGWNLIREDLGAAAPSSRSYVWGLDLSQSLQGAGGVGGLLAILSPDSCLLSPAYDANGNVTDLVDTSGVVVAHYEYDPFGNTVAQSGDQADANPFRFSSKYWDGETGFYYYGYRFYSPKLGRWISRDLIEEGGGINLYVYAQKNPIDTYDVLGLIAARHIFTVTSSHEHGNYLGYSATCSKCSKVVNISIDYSNVEQCIMRQWLFNAAHGHHAYYPDPLAAFRSIIGDNGSLGGLRNQIGDTPCDGTDVLIEAFMRTRLVAGGASGFLWRMLNSMPSAGHSLSCYESLTKVTYDCAKCGN